MYLRGRVTLLIAIGVAWWTVAGGAEIETLNVRSAPKVLGPLNVETTAEHKNVAPNGETIITATFEGWLDEEEPSEERPSMMKPRRPESCTDRPIENDHETFFGTNREVAKTQVDNSSLEEANLTVRGYYASIRQRGASDADKRKQSFKSTDCDIERVDVEKRNVTIAAYLVAAKKEKDNDYHLILQDKDCSDPTCRLTVEVSSVPRLSASKPALTAVRQKFKEQWRIYTGRAQVPGSGPFVFFVTPILVRVTGSAFYDTDHPINPVTGKGPVGPECCKPGSAWELHPVTSFEFAPEQ